MCVCVCVCVCVCGVGVHEVVHVWNAGKVNDSMTVRMLILIVRGVHYLPH